MSKFAHISKSKIIVWRIMNKVRARLQMGSDYSSIYLGWTTSEHILGRSKLHTIRLATFVHAFDQAKKFAPICTCTSPFRQIYIILPMSLFTNCYMDNLMSKKEYIHVMSTIKGGQLTCIREEEVARKSPLSCLKGQFNWDILNPMEQLHQPHKPWRDKNVTRKQSRRTQSELDDGVKTCQSKWRKETTRKLLHW